MKRGTILNAELSRAVASMGHGDLMIVCDAGFPIPRDAWRIDLALCANVPDLATVLGVLAEDLVAERVVYADEMAANNPPLTTTVRALFADAEHDTVSHERMLNQLAAQAKVIVRTGAFDPWGNIGLVSGVDVARWFADSRISVPDYYADKVAR